MRGKERGGLAKTKKFLITTNASRNTRNLTSGSCVSVRMGRCEARGKFGERERGVRVARVVAQSNYRLLT